MNVVIPLAEPLSVSTNTAFGSVSTQNYDTTFNGLVATSQGLASIYGPYLYYRVRRAYFKFTPKVKNFDGLLQVGVATGVPIVSHMKPRFFSLPHTTSFDSDPAGFQPLLEYGGKKEYPVDRTIRVRCACTVEDGLAASGILGTAYMPRKCPWIETARGSLPIYMTKIAVVAPKRMSGANTDIVVQEWDVELHACVELKRFK